MSIKLPASFKMSVAVEQARRMYSTESMPVSDMWGKDMDWMFHWLNVSEDSREQESIGYVFH